MMKRHTRIMFFMLLVMLLALTGCEKTYTGSETDTQDTSDTEEQTETAQETEKETNPATVRESVESEKVTEGSNQNKKVYESDLGYSVIYDESLFENNRKGDYDEIGMKGQTFSSKPVFFAAMKLKNEDIPAVLEQIFNNSVQETTIGTKAYSAICQPTTEEVDGGKELKYHNQYLVELANGDALLFEVQWFETVKDDAAAEAAKETETTADSETVTEAEETQNTQETAENVKETAAEAETDSSKAEKAEKAAENASRKLEEMLDSIEINVPVKGEAIPQSTETAAESEAEFQQSEEVSK